MRKFKPSFGEEVDLDSSATYEHLPNTTKELRDLFFKEVGYMHCYTKYWHKDAFEKSEQMKRIKKLLKNFTLNEVNNITNVMWYQEQVFLFQDEIENMC